MLVPKYLVGPQLIPFEGNAKLVLCLTVVDHLAPKEQSLLALFLVIDDIFGLFFLSKEGDYCNLRMTLLFKVIVFSQMIISVFIS